MYIYIYSYTFVYIYKCIYIYLFIYIYIYTYIYEYIPHPDGGPGDLLQLLQPQLIMCLHLYDIFGLLYMEHVI